MTKKLLFLPVIGLGAIIALTIIYLHIFYEVQPQYSKLQPYPKAQTQYSEARPLQYLPPAIAHNSTPGKPMNINKTILDIAHLPDENFSELTADTVKDFVFVTAVSHDHFLESLDAIGTVRKMMPQHKIYFYGLGLPDEDVVQAKLFCQVIYVKFEFDAYPKHVKKLHSYAFKPIIIHEVLKSHSAAVWMDASFRLLIPLENVYSNILKARGFMFLGIDSPHSCYAVTEQRMYEFLPSNQEQQKRTNQKGSGGFYIHKTKELYWSVVYWWAMCALDGDCTDPKGSTLTCDFSSGDPNNVYAKCHRYDQSSLNILVSNMYGYDVNAYTVHNVADIKGAPGVQYNVTTLQC